MTQHPTPKQPPMEDRRRVLAYLQKYRRHLHARYLTLPPDEQERWWTHRSLQALRQAKAHDE